MAYVSTESPTLGQGPKHFGAAPQGDGLQTLGISSAGMGRASARSCAWAGPGRPQGTWARALGTIDERPGVRP